MITTLLNIIAICIAILVIIFISLFIYLVAKWSIKKAKIMSKEFEYKPKTSKKKKK